MSNTIDLDEVIFNIATLFDAAMKLQEPTLIDPVKNPIETEDCYICMENLGNTNKMILRCGHQFCGDCILHHFQLENGTACPVCRQQFASRVHHWKTPDCSELDDIFQSEELSLDEQQNTSTEISWHLLP